MPKKPTTPTFADTLTQLEALTTRLEDSETSLEQSLQDFEQGVQLIRQAQQSLQEAEQKVQLLLEKDGKPVAQAFEDPGAAENDGE
ncbi:exodeoxyribonuclease VII small subunit [Haliea sp. E1-2-M8]|uniref:exodeoxyribonuclease VII small subunit n=1 Tax=Haliea sp. E1-2-M8 TaxID=3064706 RepID=UPI002721E92C|nr:exodeoxyribonuclease VII small subunit [Haliea sp. E1-2-M8]MDO8863485.1 exodeoxyribonuclease VII small subunit [Haliea sp. E1-2-M8]